MEHFECLGYYHGETKLDALLAALDVNERPILPRGDTDTYLSNEAAGIELTFSDSASLSAPQRDYPAGALVLVNIRYYGKRLEEFSIYQGNLPYGLTFGLKKSELIALLGEPEWRNPEGLRLRWIRGHNRIHVTVSNSEGAIIVSLGLPL